MQKGCRYAVSRCIQGNLQRASDEPGHSWVDIDFLQGRFCIAAITLQADELLDGRRTRADLTHSLQIQLEVAAMSVAGIRVRLLTQHDLIDQACCLWVRWRQPGQAHTGEVMLQALGQAHEVPNCEDVVLHKVLQLWKRIYLFE